MSKELIENVANNVAQREMQDLTEKWKNRTLYGGWYFLEFENGSILPVYYCGFNREFEFGWDWKISKVLAPASYDHFVELTEKANQFSQVAKKVEELEKRKNHFVELTNKYMDKYDDKFKKNTELVQKMHILNEANMNLKNTIGTLGEQLKEANEVIKYYADSFFGDKQKDGTYLIYTRENALGRVQVTYNPNIANNYLEKWGVK